MWMLAARERRGQNARGRNVIDKAASTRHQRLVFEAKNARTNRAHAH